MKRTAKSIECGLQVVEGAKQWRFRSFAYLAKRKDKLFVNIAIQDINSKKVDGSSDFILSRCIVTKQFTKVEYSEFNNCSKVELTTGQHNLVVMCARAIYREYFKEVK